jgi:hypothetical protein
MVAVIVPRDRETLALRPSARLAARRAGGRGVPASPQRIGCSAGGATEQSGGCRFSGRSLKGREVLPRLGDSVCARSRSQPMARPIRL